MPVTDGRTSLYDVKKKRQDCEIDLDLGGILYVCRSKAVQEMRIWPLALGVQA